MNPYIEVGDYDLTQGDQRMFDSQVSMDVTGNDQFFEQLKAEMKE